MLTSEAKCFVMALLYLSQPLPVVELEAWVRSDSRPYVSKAATWFHRPCGLNFNRRLIWFFRSERDQALNLLERLHVLTAITNAGQPRSYSLTNPFKSSLRLALTGGGDHKSFGAPCKVSRRDAVSVAELDEFARKQWEGVLGYMVGSTGIDLASDGVKLSQGVKTLLQMGGLVEAKNRRVEITQDGFAFILQEINAQVWTVLILYLENAHKVCPFKTHWMLPNLLLKRARINRC